LKIKEKEMKYKENKSFPPKRSQTQSISGPINGINFCDSLLNINFPKYSAIFCFIFPREKEEDDYLTFYYYFKVLNANFLSLEI
jgi:hypothetical protein